jgi:hypothetical protein
MSIFDDGAGTPSVLQWFVEAMGDDVDYATECNTEATVFVENFIGADNPYGVPDEAKARAILEVGADLFYRKNSRNGIVSYESGMPAPEPVRLQRDPMTAAYPILRPFLPAPGL